MDPSVPAACPHTWSMHDEVPLRDQKFDRLDGIGKNRRILPQKLLDLIKTPSLDARRCFAMADNIRCDEVVERIRLTAVPCVEETPDYGLVLLCRCAHGEAPSLLSFIRSACGWAGALNEATIASLAHVRHVVLPAGRQLSG
jgi:hypothetical protein